MATVTFGATTIWNDASTGVGSVRAAASGPQERAEYDALPRTNWRIRRGLGKEPQTITVSMEFLLDSTAFNTLISTLSGLVGTNATLAVPPGQSYTYCWFSGYTTERGPAVSVAGSIKYQVTINALFSRAYTV